MGAPVKTVATEKLPPRKHRDLCQAKARCDQILNAAESCFRQRGFHNASMTEIARTAAMSPGHIYNYFACKEDIIAAIIQRDIDKCQLRLQQIGNADNVLDAVMDGALEALPSNLDPERSGLMLEIFAEAGRNPAVAAMAQSVDAASRQALMSLIKTGLGEQGKLSDQDIEARVEIMITLLQGLYLRSVVNKETCLAARHDAMRLVLAVLLSDRIV